MSLITCGSIHEGHEWFSDNSAPLLGQVKKKTTCFSSGFLYKRERAGGFFVIYYFLLHAFFTHYYLLPGIRWSSYVKY